MPITSVSSDPAALTLTVVADYSVSIERLWEAYADPRQLERFWGPEQWPATFLQHDMAVGGRSHYYMTGPDGTISRGWFRFLYVTDDKYIKDARPVDEGCDCPTCRRYSRGYLRHLYRANEAAFQRLATLHNLRFMVRLMAALRASLPGLRGVTDGIG